MQLESVINALNNAVRTNTGMEKKNIIGFYNYIKVLPKKKGSI